MRNNLVFFHFPECERENQDDIKIKLRVLFAKDMNLTGADDIAIDICHRIFIRGKQHLKRARDIVARFSLLSDKHLVLRSGIKFKGREPPMFINEQYRQDIESKRLVLRPIVNTPKGLPNCHAFLVRDKIVIKGKAYSTDIIDQIPFDTSTSETRVIGNIFQFSGVLSTLSNLHPCRFDIDNFICSCLEQFYQRSKALFACNQDAAYDIMMTDDHASMKGIGDKLVIEATKWQAKSESVLVTGLKAMFYQTKHVRDALSDNGDTDIIECNRYDTFWSSRGSLK